MGTCQRNYIFSKLEGWFPKTLWSTHVYSTKRVGRQLAWFRKLSRGVLGCDQGVAGRAKVVEISEDNEWKMFMRTSKP